MKVKYLLFFFVSYIQPKVWTKNCSKKDPCNQSSHYEIYGWCRIPHHLKVKHPTVYISLPTMFNLLHSSMNHESLEKVPCSQCTHYKMWTISVLCKGSHHTLATVLPNLLFAKMNSIQSRILISPALYILQYSKRYHSGWSDIKQWKKWVYTFSPSQIISVWTCQVVSNYSVSRKSC